MEDDDETHSHQSVGSGSGSEDSQRYNPRISVTLPSDAPLQMTVTLVLSIRYI
ncbi:hypothetical protein Hanom_Chr14g01264711 [Helianthus anomalus]